MVNGPDVIFLAGSASPGAVLIFTALGSASHRQDLVGGLALALSGLGAAAAAMTGTWWLVVALACAGVFGPSTYLSRVERSPAAGHLGQVAADVPEPPDGPGRGRPERRQR